jgi:hypothetical protein
MQLLSSPAAGIRRGSITRTQQSVISPIKYTDKKENKIFLIYKEIQRGSGAKSYMRKGFLIYEEMRKYFATYKEAVTHI